MDEAAIARHEAVVPHDDSTEGLQPRVAALDNPTPLVSTQLPAVLESWARAVPAMWHDEIDASESEIEAELIGVVATVRDGSAQLLLEPSILDFGDRRDRELRLPFRCCRNADSDRYSLALDQNSQLRALAALCEANCVAPFFAGMNVASRNVSSQSRKARSSSMPSNARQASFQTPCSSHTCNRRQHVLPLGYFSGMSRHRAPVLNTHRMPSKHSRLPAGGRPRPSARRFGSGNIGSRTDHCSSVSNLDSRLAISQIKPRSRKKYKDNLAGF